MCTHRTDYGDSGGFLQLCVQSQRDLLCYGLGMPHLQSNDVISSSRDSRGWGVEGEGMKAHKKHKLHYYFVDVNSIAFDLHFPLYYSNFISLSHAANN